MSILRHLTGGTERRDFSGNWGPYADGRIPPPGMDGVSSAGVIVNERTAMQLIDSYACTSLISDAISMLPSGAFRKAADVRTPVSPAPSVVAQPDPEIEAGEYWARATMSILLRGNAYSAIVERDAAGWPTALKQLHPDDVHPRRNSKTRLIEYQLSNGDVLQRFDMVHVPWVTLPGQLQALSPIECARRGLGSAIATENFGANWFRDGAAPSSVLESDNEVDDTEAKRSVANWVAAHGGRRRPAVLSGGLKWRAITITPEESQFLGTQELNTERSARLWRVPPHMIGHTGKSTSWGSGIEEQGIGFVVYTLGPHLMRFEAAMTRILPRPQYHKFNVAALLRGNTRDRFTSYAIGRQWGWLSVNDIRALEDLPPVDGGDTYLQPLNMIDAQEALKVLLQPSPSGGGPPNG